MINSPQDAQDFALQRDLLEFGRGNRESISPELADNNRLLRQILMELRKTHPSIRCSIDVQYTNPLKILAGPLDRADIRFLYQGKPVKAQKLIVGQSVNRQLNIAINEPAVTNSAGDRGNGIWFLANVSNPQFIELTAEIEWISISLVTNTTTNTISVGAPPITGITAGTTGGHIPIYAWTVPQADRIETE